MAVPSTFKNVQDAVIAKVRLDPTADLAKVKDWINQTYSNVALQSKFFEGSAAGSTLVAGATSETLPTALIELEDVTCTFAGTSPRLKQIGWEQLLDLRQFSTGTGPPQAYSLRKNSVEFFPAAQGGELLTYYGSKQPDAYLSADSDVSLLPEPFGSKLLEYGACVQACEFKNDILMLGNHQQSYGYWLGQFLEFCNVRLGQDALRFRVLLGRGGGVPHDPSSDWFVVNGVPWT